MDVDISSASSKLHNGQEMSRNERTDVAIARGTEARGRGLGSGGAKTAKRVENHFLCAPASYPAALCCDGYLP